MTDNYDIKKYIKLPIPNQDMFYNIKIKISLDLKL